MTISKLLSAVVAATLLSSCGSSEQPQNLTGAGATFPNPIYSKWFSEYQKANPLIQINYQSLGSGAGIKQVTEGTVDFGASDQPMTEEQLANFTKAHSSRVLHFPTVMGAVVPIYNIPGVTGELNFTGAALAGIYLGKIKTWNGPAIQSMNPDVKLPAAPIEVVHRSDGSGTTFVFTDFLSKVSPEWATAPGKGAAINWPVGLGGKGSEGLTGLVKQTPNSIGYTEMIYAAQNNITMGRVQNIAGKFVKASPETVSTAASQIPMPEDFRVSITNSPGDDSYPISSFTWLLIPEKIGDEGKRKVVTEFLKWMLTTGQTMAPALQYAPLPAAVMAKEQAAIGMIQ